MSGFHDVRFPLRVASGATGGPGFSTDIVAVSGGEEQRNENWSQERSRYDAATGIRSREQMAEVLAFFRARKGRAYSFRFRDCLDYRATGQPMRRISPTVWQLRKGYSSGDVTYWREITKPVAGTVQVTVAGIAAAPVVDHATGRVTFESEPSDAPVASFEFDVHCRFDVDQLSISLLTLAVQSSPPIPIVEVRG